MCSDKVVAALPSNNGIQVARADRLRPFSSSASQQAKAKGGHQRKYRDPYIIAQARARKAANLSKQEALRVSRTRALGDPVRGVETDFLRSFDNPKHTQASGTPYLNNFLTQDEIDTQLDSSKTLLKPRPQTIRDWPSSYDNETPEMHERIADVNRRTEEKWSAAHETVEEAMKRIINIDNGNSKDRFRINVDRCINTFGRHETDKVLPQRLLPLQLGPKGIPRTDLEAQPLPLKERKGPDTGSSEVQIAILTAKIRNLANHLDQMGNKDKMNKRNLRLLVHRRQKLLQYLRRKEKAGPRWQKCIDMLGLTEGTWRGEITL